MPRGSKIGERRGGRDRGTPNRRTVLVDRILEIASGRAATSADELIETLVQDQKLPTNLRMAIVRSRVLSFSNNQRRKDKSADREPSNTAKRDGLKMFFGIVLDESVAPNERRNAALEATQFLLPKKSGAERWWIYGLGDEYDFIITPKVAGEYRDIKFELRALRRSQSTSISTRKKVEKLHARLNTIRHRMQCPCPSLYGEDQMSADRKRLIYFLEQRDNTTLNPEESADEAHCRARLDSVDEGPEGMSKGRLYVLKDKERIARNGGPRLTPKECTDLRFLRVLYSYPSPHYDPCSDELLCPDYHPFRNEPLAEDGNLYPPDPRLRPLDDAGFTELAHLLRHCYPPHARMPPLKYDDVLYVDSKGFRWSTKLVG
jgi:hypothetical protein